jgi:hypothetical protein
LRPKSVFNESATGALRARRLELPSGCKPRKLFQQLRDFAIGDPKVAKTPGWARLDQLTFD